MNKLKYFKYVCIDFLAELLAALAGALIAYEFLLLPILPLSMLLPIVIGIFISILFGKIHRYCRSAILWRLMMDTRVYTIFAQILSVVGIFVIFCVLVDIAAKSNQLGGVAVFWTGLIGAGTAFFTALAGQIYQILPPDRYAPHKTYKQTQDNEKTEV